MKLFIAIPAIFALCLAGCSNIGNAPEPMTSDEVNKSLAEAKPEDQIAFWQSSPAPAAEKEKKIAEIRAKYGLTDSGSAATGTTPPVPNR